MGSYQANRSPGFDAHSYTIRDVTGLAVAIHIWLDGPDGKRFRWTLPDGTSGLGGLRAVDLPLYGIDRLTAESTVIVVEGEKAAEALWSLGIQAVGTVTGAGTILSRRSPGRAQRPLRPAVAGQRCPGPEAHGSDREGPH